MSPQAPRRALRVVQAPQTERPESAFCGHCGHPPAEAPTGGKPSRVCNRCHLGLILTTDAELAPSPRDPFLVIDGSLTICALSEHAERLLEVSETQAINRHISEFLVPADAEARPGRDLISVILMALGSEAPMREIVLRPANEFGVRLWAHIGACGPPSAALLVLADRPD
jgi:hypothetical protein